jgi:alpha-glucoside transport system permease protein
MQNQISQKGSFTQKSIMRMLLSLLGLVVLITTLWFSVSFMSNDDAPKWLTALVAFFVGVFGIGLLFYFGNNFIESFPEKISTKIRPFIFVGPAVLILGFFLIYPAISTIYLSLFNRDSSKYIGLENYLKAFSDSDFLIIFRNNILWMLFVTFFTVSIGLLIAVLADRIKRESLVKSLIFMPMAISSVGASIIWRFVYYFQPAGRQQIGLLNAIWVKLGNLPVAWITKREVPIPLITNLMGKINLNFTFPLNTFLLIVIMIWLQTGFAMVVISAAVKGVPSELLEAAQIDGATEKQIFFKITIPYIKSTLLTITTTILILVLKVFDIVYVMTSGQFDTQVIANEMYLQMFKWRDFGMGSTLAVILFIAVTPVIVNNIRNWNKERNQR